MTLFWNIKSLYFTYSHSYSFVLSLAVIRCHSLLFSVTHCHLLSLVVTRYHSLSLSVPLIATRCHSLYYSLPLVVIRCTTRCHSLSFPVPLVIICCHCFHSLFHSLPFVVTRCYALSLDVSLACLFIKDPARISISHIPLIYLDYFLTCNASKYRTNNITQIYEALSKMWM